MKFWRNQAIEEAAELTLSRYEQQCGVIGRPPVPMDLVIEHAANLKISWERITERDGQTILGGLRPTNRQIVLNENHIALFNDKPGLERSTKGHELGHWVLFVNETELNHPTLFETETGEISCFRCESTEGPVSVLRGLSFDEKAADIVVRSLKQQDQPDEARAVNRYAAVISMPKRLFIPAVKSFDVKSWSGIYSLAELFDVTPTAAYVRLRQLKIDCVNADKRGWGMAEKIQGKLNLR